MTAMTGAAALEHFSWTRYAVMAAAYTVIVFTGRGGPALSTPNRAPVSAIVRMHAVFLAILLALMWMASVVVPTLPAWMKQPWLPGRVSPSSNVDIVFILILVGMLATERYRIINGERYRGAEQ